MSLCSIQQRLRQLETQKNDLQQQCQVSKILYQQLLEAYNNANDTQLCRSNQIKILSELHEQQKAKLKRQFQESISNKVRQFKDVLEEIEDLREKYRDKEMQAMALEEMLNQERGLRLSQTRKLEIELDDLAELNRKIKESQQFAIHRLIGKHNEEMQGMKDRIRAEYQEQIERYQEHNIQTREAAQKSVACAYQQLANQEAQHKILTDNLKRVQKMFQDHQARYMQDRFELQNNCQQLQKQLVKIKEHCHNLEAKNAELELNTCELRKSNKEMQDKLRKLELSSAITKRMQQKQCQKERSLSARLINHIKLQEKDLQYRELQNQNKQKEQKAKQKKLIEGMSNIKQKFQKENSELFQKLILTERRGNQSKIKKSKGHQSLLDLLKSSCFDDFPSELVTQIQRTPQPLDLKELDLSSKQHPFDHTFDNISKLHPTLDTTMNEQKQQRTYRKKAVQHLRIKSNIQTTRHSIDKPKMLVEIQTPCFEDHLKATAVQPRKINIKLKK